MVPQGLYQPRLATLSVTLLALASMAHAGDTPSPDEGHLHIGFGNSAGARLQANHIDRLAAEVGSEGFLQKKATDSANPLSPCALLTATVTGMMVNRLFSEVVNRSLRQPPPGTNILGKYDSITKRWSGALPSDPTTAADMLARFAVVRAWSANATATSMLSDLTQGTCLTVLTDESKIAEIVPTPGNTTVTLAHPNFISTYFTSTDQAEGDALLDALPTPEMLAKPASDRANPLMPCTLLRSFRLGARLNDDWQKIGAGKLQIPDNALLLNYPPEAGQSPLPDESPLKPLADKLRDAAFLRSGSPEAAMVVSRALGHEIVRTNQLTDMLLNASQATQADCLAEIREPLTLRLRLIDKKISLPLR